MLKTLTLIAALAGGWTYTTDPNTGVVIRAQRTQRSDGEVVHVYLPGDEMLPAFKNGLPALQMKVNVNPIERAFLEPYILRALSKQAEEAMDEGDLKKAKEILQQIRGIQAKPAEDTKDTTPTAPEPPKKKTKKTKKKDK